MPSKVAMWIWTPTKIVQKYLFPQIPYNIPHYQASTTPSKTFEMTKFYCNVDCFSTLARGSMDYIPQEHPHLKGLEYFFLLTLHMDEFTLLSVQGITIKMDEEQR